MSRFTRLILTLTALVLFSGPTAHAKPVQFPLPGKSAASVQLQKDTLKAALTAASMAPKADKSCKQAAVVNTAIIRLPKNPVQKNGVLIKGAWEEAWTVNRCGKLLKVPVVFTPDGHGGTLYDVYIPE